MAKLKDLKVTIGLSKKGLTKLNGDIRRMKGNFRRNFGEIASMAKNLAMSIGTTLVGAVSAMIAASAKMETVKVSFRSIMGGADGAARMVAKLNKFAANTPFQLEDISTAARQLLAVGTKESAIESTLKTLGDLAAANGASITEMSAIYAKAQAKGKIDQEILNQLLDRGINIQSELIKVTGQTGDEFKATSVSVEDFNQAIRNMADEGGIAEDAMLNLSSTTNGLLSTLKDVSMQFAAQAADQSGISDYFKMRLVLAIAAFQDQIGTTAADVDNLKQEFTDLMAQALEPTTENIDDVESGLGNLEKSLKAALDKTSEGTDEYRRLNSMLNEVVATTIRLNKAVLGGTLPDAPPSTGGGGEAETLEQFTARFNAAADLREEQERLNEATFQHVVAAGDEAEALAGVTDAMFGMQGGMEVLLDEEQELFDEDSQERIAEGTRLIQNAALAAANVGAVMGTMSGLVGAAFDNIKDSSQGFHLYIKSMLEDLVKRAISLVATFAALSLLTGGSAGALSALGQKSFKSFFMGGMGLAGFAEGGLVTGATLAMVGEGPGTSLSNPEVIAPLDKLQQMMGGGNLTVTGRLDGRDILISSERAGFDRNRVRGF